MNVSVEFDENCEIDFGELNPDAEALIIECLKSLRECFEDNAGMPSGARPIATKNGVYSWDDGNWHVIFRLVPQKSWLASRRVTVIIDKIKLLRVP